MILGLRERDELPAPHAAVSSTFFTRISYPAVPAAD